MVKVLFYSSLVLFYVCVYISRESWNQSVSLFACFITSIIINHLEYISVMYNNEMIVICLMRFIFWIIVVWGSQITLSYHLSTLKIACRGDQISLNSGKRTSGGNYVENTVFKRVNRENSTIIGNRKVGTSDKISFPELDESGFNETALRSSLFGKVLFGVLDNVFPILKEPNWYDIYDPPLTKEENMELPYFDGNDFINSTWTVYIRHRYGVWNWLDRMGLVPVQVHKVFFRPDGRTVWSDHFYGDWFLNPALNYFQFERHYGRGQGIYQYWRLADSLK